MPAQIGTNATKAMRKGRDLFVPDCMIHHRTMYEQDCRKIAATVGDEYFLPVNLNQRLFIFPANSIYAKGAKEPLVNSWCFEVSFTA